MFVLSLAWLSATIYAGIATKWLRASQQAPRPARIAGGFSLVTSGITYAMVIALIVLSVVVMILSARATWAVLKEWLERQR